MTKTVGNLGFKVRYYNLGEKERDLLSRRIYFPIKIKPFQFVSDCAKLSEKLFSTS